jgi:hypothetical protein
MIKVKERNPHTGSPTRFKAKHVVVWEKKHGPVPKGTALIFKDGNVENCRIGNLEIVTRAELLKLNQLGYRKFPSQLKPTVLILAKLKTKTSQLNRKSSAL